MKLIFLLLAITTISGRQQTEMKITVYANDMVTKTVGATVKNVSGNKLAKIGTDSMYILQAKPGDTIEVSMKGFTSISIPAPNTDKPFGIAIYSEKN